MSVDHNQVAATRIEVGDDLLIGGIPYEFISFTNWPDGRATLELTKREIKNEVLEELA